MKQPKKILASLFLLIVISLTYTSTIWANTPVTELKDRNQYFANQDLLSGVFEKLYNLEKYKKGKVNIVHIGDSHIQADIFTNTIRESLQDLFGNGGYGFTFPYSLLRTNGTRSVRYVSDATWQSLLNVYPVADVGMGLSGIALYTSSQRFVVQLTAEEKYKFNTVKIIYPSEEPYYKMSVTGEPLEVVSTTKISSAGGVKYHKIRRGESLSSIGRKYGVTVAQIKTANGMRSNTIHPGKTLKIPTKGGQAKAQVSNLKVNEKDLNFVPLVSKPYYSSYTSDSLLDHIMILPDTSKFTSMYNLNGFVIENDEPGVIYHTIGVNGSKLSDYNKYPRFFKQLPILKPDLIILSFGTNESFGKVSALSYIDQLDQFVQNIRQKNPQATILVMTPPPSMFRRRRPNPYVTDYSVALMGMNNLPVWDLYGRMGGLAGIALKGEYSDLIARDKVHYTSKGYQTQGSMFASDFIDAYNDYKKLKKKQ
ncbi:MAG: GDSL-type esterase/lipase family protein [Dysgonomonas sp.]